VEAHEDEDADWEGSDQVLLDELHKELEDSVKVDEHEIPTLMWDGINVGCFSIFKVIVQAYKCQCPPSDHMFLKSNRL